MIQLNIKLWPGLRGYYWAVPTKNNMALMSVSGDIGTAVRDAHKAALETYGSELGNVNFHLSR